MSVQGVRGGSRAAEERKAYQKYFMFTDSGNSHLFYQNLPLRLPHFAAFPSVTLFLCVE
jgi:hypothetical protein